MVILSERLWHTRFGGDPELAGKTVTVDGVTCEVAGVAPDSFRPPADEQLHPLVQLGPRIDVWKPAAFAAIARVDPEVPPANLRTMDQVAGRSLAQRRFQVLLVLLFAGGALLLAGLGIYGVVSYTVTRRTNEFGIRLALGAGAPALYRMVLAQGMTPVALGLAAGLAGALAAGRALAGLLFEVKPADPVTFAAVAMVLAAVALAACMRPAIRAARTDPLSALRYE